MPIPNVNPTIADNGLGAAVAGAGGTMVVIGCSDDGTDYEIITSTEPSDFSDASGFGPGVELAGFVTNQTGNPAIWIKAPTASNGTNTAITTTRVGSSTSVVTVSGNPSDSYQALATVTTGGTRGTAGIIITLSLDGGRTTYITINLGTASTYAIPNTGLTLNFAAGTLEAGDTFEWWSTEPRWNTAGVVSAIEQLYGVSLAFQDILIVGGGSVSTVGGPGASAADATSIQTAMVALFNRKRFSRALMNARDASYGGQSTETEAAWMTALAADYVSNDTDRVGVTAGHYNVISPYSQTQFRRPLLFQAGARDSDVEIQVDLARVADGALASTVNSPPATADGYIYHDEDQNPLLDAARFLTARRFPLRPGWFITNPNLFAAPGSDFTLLQYGHVMDAATSIGYQFFVGKLSDSVRVDSASGKILEVDAQALEGGCNAQLKAGLIDTGEVSDAFCVVNRTTNILSTRTLKVTISVIPLGYMKQIDMTLTFLNPALLQAA